ncbi:MAG: Type II secretion system protein D [Luteibacter sp.]|uniref:type II secretion system secretin GspD n=1 Tax=Luteibacter sp. TaxID=1886636 RepID=UPI001384BF7E|nr:type II secretion system secretin GspD [Luteibacter sp.]KAF1008187.1 MAG: Type II secretion system protein D [Luteibacter sp.]
MQRRTLGVAVLSAILATACAPQAPRPYDSSLEREALAGTERPVPKPLPLADADATNDTASALSPATLRGTGRFVQPRGLEKPRASIGGEGAVTLNFENQPVEAVVKAILGDLLDMNYSIAPGVMGSVSFSTSKPVRKEDVLSILETLLGWTGNALVEDKGRYAVMPSSYAVAGRVVPRLKASSSRAGMSARLYPLRYVAAPEMTKLLQPFVTPESILLTDPARNVLVLSGTPEQLANYGETIDTFDVDWVKGMSVGVFSLDNAGVGEVMPALDSVFGQKSGAPVAGLVRFIPIQRTNAIVAIATRAEFLDQVGEWIDRIDHGGGSEPRLFVYDVRNLVASDLARYVGNIFGASVAADSPSSATVVPGLSSATLDGDGGGLDAPSQGEDSDPDFFKPPEEVSAPAASSRSGGSRSSGIRVTAVDANNQLMIHARPSQWAQIRQAIERLDAVPLQVQIETRILEVTLRDNFRFGVQWYLEGLAGGDGEVAQPGNKQQWALGSATKDALRPDTFFYSFVNSDLQVALRAMEQNTNTKILSAPSLVVVNNRKAKIQVGDQIPVTQTYVNTGVGNGNQVGQVEYKDTGVILEVRPRVNPGGLVYLDVVQEVSRADLVGPGSNAPIVKRKLNTQVAVQSGQTVLLGGLIRDMDSEQHAGVPLLSRMPVIGRLFGEQSKEGMRTELLVLITPKVITSGEDAKRVFDEYRRTFRSLRPLDSEVVDRDVLKKDVREG